jgi:phosphoenolpyruvate carboxykinase (ATP)
MKKSIFYAMNYDMPEVGRLPHALLVQRRQGTGENVRPLLRALGHGQDHALRRPQSRLIGDDEHGWSDHGVFNFEGGCYAKCIKLSKTGEPEIWNAIKFGSSLRTRSSTITRVPDYDSAKLTENTRVTYPVDFIEGGHPQRLRAPQEHHLPHRRRLRRDAPGQQAHAEQAMYYFINGYTSKLAGTEAGVTEPEPNFSPCFGGVVPAPPAHRSTPSMLAEKIKQHGANVWLLNTGWTGGPYGVGSRFKLAYTRALVTAILNGSLAKAEYTPTRSSACRSPRRRPGVVPRERPQAPQHVEGRRGVRRAKAKGARQARVPRQRSTTPPVLSRCPIAISERNHHALHSSLQDAAQTYTSAGFQVVHIGFQRWARDHAPELDLANWRRQ